MKTRKTIRTLSVIASAALIVGAFAAGPADAKKKKKKPAPAGCPAYVPSQWSADVPVTIVNDTHTADAPLELTVPTEKGAGTSDPASPENGQASMAAHAFLNVQVDSANPEVGLYGTLEFTPVFDYDLYFRGNDGVGLAYSAGTAPAGPFGLDGTGHGGHSGAGSENIEGLVTADCAGYLVDVITSLGSGGDVTLKLWLGEGTYVPQ